MKILVINCGSSSLKYQLIDMDHETVIAKGLCERIGIAGSKPVSYTHLDVYKRQVYHWPEPYGFDATKEELKTSRDFSFDEEGIQAGIDWLNEAYEKQYEKRD